MLALCTAVTRRRPFSLANLKAYSAIRRELFRVMIFRDSTTPGTLYHKHRDLITFTVWTNCSLVCVEETGMNGGISGVYLMLQAAVLPLCVLSNDDNINVLVAGLNTRQGLAVHQVCI